MGRVGIESIEMPRRVFAFQDVRELLPEMQAANS